MNGKFSDIVKTVGAIVIIGGIIVATFLYGNKQRQDQIRRDQQIRQTQQQQATQANQTANNEQQASQQPSSGNPQSAPAGTAPANSGVAQQSGGSNPTVAAGVNSGTPQPTPAAQAQPSQTPATGGSVLSLLPLAMIVVLWRMHRNARQELQSALRA